MTRFSPRRDASLSTSSVAIIVTATPLTEVFGSPDLNVSTVRSGTLTCALSLIRAMMLAAVGCAPTDCAMASARMQNNFLVRRLSEADDITVAVAHSELHLIV